jgi:ligand-binding SRPBCC domain-containing protein
MVNFHYSSLINAPLETVWNFHERRDILQILTPPWQPIKVIRREGGLGIGAITEFRLFIGIIPVKWISRHTECEPNHFFVDEQIEGPMASWKHRHELTRDNGKTRLKDAIEYSLPGGLLAELLLGWLVQQQLKEMFRYRHEVTKRECEVNGNNG